jgi:glycosyltransferase involved in cell wall biosynthesis
MSIYHNDRLKFVRESVESILDQTLRDFHYYLVFDGPVSEDIDSYVSGLTDERIRFFRLGKNGGLAAAMNFLLEKVLAETKYQYIARMDADDVSMPERFEKQREYLINNLDITVLGSWYEEIDDEGKHLAFRRLPTDHESLRKRYFTRTPFAHPSVMFRRELIEKAGYYPTDTILMEDNVLWGRALKEGLKFSNIQENLMKFRITNDFFKRRSGLKYGGNYIITKLRSNRNLRAPGYIYPFVVGVGLFKVFPPFISKSAYHFQRRLSS